MHNDLFGSWFQKQIIISTVMQRTIHEAKIQTGFLITKSVLNCEINLALNGSVSGFQFNFLYKKKVIDK
jgi:hypothetical protein